MTETASPSTSAIDAGRTWMLPRLDGDDEWYRLVRNACVAARFDEATLCSRFGLPTITDFRSHREGRVDATRFGDALEVLTDLFMDLDLVPVKTARELLGADVVAALCDLQLVEAGNDDGPLSATMLLYPTAGVLLTSDRTFGRPGEVRDLIPDIVYPAITRTTSMFMRMLPTSGCDAFLEMCAGNGIAAIAMADRARHCWSLDITDRATAVARFNARLNDVHNVTVAQGDLYEPVAGQMFDRIVAHPPYVPASAQQIVYRDGGPDGESITRRLVAGLPQHLRPGGRFACTCIATDRADGPLEQRLRTWLGNLADEFDVVVAVTSAEHPSEHYFKKAINGNTTFADAERRHEQFKAMQVERLVYSSFIIERHAAIRAPASVRLSRGPSTTGHELEQLCNWLSRRDDPDVQHRMLSAFPRVDRGATLRQTQRLSGERWTTGDVEFQTPWPFHATVSCPEDVAQFLARCNGSRTVRQLITAMRQRGELKAGVHDEAVLQVLSGLVIAGALFLEDAEHREP